MKNLSELPKKRGRKADEMYAREILLKKFRELIFDKPIVEKLNLSSLEKATGIGRKHWYKIKNEIDNFNNRTIGVGIENLPIFDSQCIEEVFDLYYGKNRNNLMEYFVSYSKHLSDLWDKAKAYETILEKFNCLLKENMELKEEIKNAKRNVEFYEKKYFEIVAESSYSKKREELNIKKNAVELTKGNKNLLKINFAEEFEDIAPDK